MSKNADMNAVFKNISEDLKTKIAKDFNIKILVVFRSTSFFIWCFPVQKSSNSIGVFNISSTAF